MTGQKPRSERFERGLKTRREVLGAEYVDRSLKQADEFAWALQQLTTEWCWDGTWNRPGLDRRSRSILNLGMLAALTDVRTAVVRPTGLDREKVDRRVPGLDHLLAGAILHLPRWNAGQHRQRGPAQAQRLDPPLGKLRAHELIQARRD